MPETRVVINTRFGGFGLSDKAYERLAELGVPIRKYQPAERDPDTGLYVRNASNEGEVIFDRELTPQGECPLNDIYWKYKGEVDRSRYWECWLSDHRTHPLLIQVIEELGEEASGNCAELKIVDIPSGVEWEISEYDGIEHVAESHRTWN